MMEVVEQHGSLSGLFEHAHPTIVGIGECPPLVTEQLTSLEMRVELGGGARRQEPWSLTQAMDKCRDSGLSGTCCSDQQEGRPGWSVAINARNDFEHRSGGGHEAV
jgi:hypothetical protein